MQKTIDNLKFIGTVLILWIFPIFCLDIAPYENEYLWRANNVLSVLPKILISLITGAVIGLCCRSIWHNNLQSVNNAMLAIFFVAFINRFYLFIHWTDSIIFAIHTLLHAGACFLIFYVVNKLSGRKGRTIDVKRSLLLTAILFVLVWNLIFLISKGESFFIEALMESSVGYTFVFSLLGLAMSYGELDVEHINLRKNILLCTLVLCGYFVIIYINNLTYLCDSTRFEGRFLCEIAELGCVLALLNPLFKILFSQQLHDCFNGCPKLVSIIGGGFWAAILTLVNTSYLPDIFFLIRYFISMPVCVYVVTVILRVIGQLVRRFKGGNSNCREIFIWW